MGYEFWPEALEATIGYAFRYTGLPMLVTENGIGTEIGIPAEVCSCSGIMFNCRVSNSTSIRSPNGAIGGNMWFS
jgi:hypothetical protein